MIRLLRKDLLSTRILKRNIFATSRLFNEDKATNADVNPELASLKLQHEELLKKFNERESKIKELQDGYLQTVADMENLRSRTKKEVENASLFAVQKFSKDLINIADVLEMATASVPKEQLTHPEAHSLRDLHEGVLMTLSEMLKCFKRHGIESMNPHLEKFDPNLHSAILEIPSVDHEPGTIILVQKKGYSLHGRIIRAATVGIAKQSQ